MGRLEQLRYTSRMYDLQFFDVKRCVTSYTTFDKPPVLNKQLRKS